MQAQERLLDEIFGGIVMIDEEAGQADEGSAFGREQRRKCIAVQGVRRMDRRARPSGNRFIGHRHDRRTDRSGG